MPQHRPEDEEEDVPPPVAPLDDDLNNDVPAIVNAHLLSLNLTPIQISRLIRAPGGRGQHLIQRIEAELHARQERNNRLDAQQARLNAERRATLTEANRAAQQEANSMSRQRRAELEEMQDAIMSGGDASSILEDLQLTNSFSLTPSQLTRVLRTPGGRQFRQQMRAVIQAR